MCFSGKLFLIFPLIFFVYDLMNDVETVFCYVLLLTYCKFGNFHMSFILAKLRGCRVLPKWKKTTLSFTDVGKSCQCLNFQRGKYGF